MTHPSAAHAWAWAGTFPVHAGDAYTWTVEGAAETTTTLVAFSAEPAKGAKGCAAASLPTTSLRNGCPAPTSELPSQIRSATMVI